MTTREARVWIHFNFFLKYDRVPSVSFTLEVSGGFICRYINQNQITLIKLNFIILLTSCGGYNDFDPSVSQSIIPVFLVSLTPLKPLDRISWNFVFMKDIMCRRAYPQEILIQFFSWSYALFELRNFAKLIERYYWNSLSVQLLWKHLTEFPENL